jgi:uridine phosphorylase
MPLSKTFNSAPFLARAPFWYPHQGKNTAMRARRDFGEPSLFSPENLLREARRQKSIPKRRIPRVCLLDPDGDIVSYLTRMKLAARNPSWACYHTVMYNHRLGGSTVGIVGNVVGAPFAVLVAEEMFASGCRLLLSLTSAGRIREDANLSRFLVIRRALRDEGTSDHYAPRSGSSEIKDVLARILSSALDNSPLPLGLGTAWTTDAPFRETATAIRRARKLGADCVEMEAAALYAFARARGKNVVCLAHVTNSMAQSKGDFEKGEENGSLDSLALVGFVLRALKDGRKSGCKF